LVNIVQTYEAGQADGVTYVAQELVTGGALADVLRARGGPFTLDETIAVLEQVAPGLDYAHRQGHLHRNLKPSNIFFADRGRVQIADFCATLATSGAVPANYSVGLPAFMAPEQARGDGNMDQRADIYSLGVVTCLMLTGRLPFEADNPLILLRKIGIYSATCEFDRHFSRSSVSPGDKRNMGVRQVPVKFCAA
jgi:serine/threonine-protein kinase